MQSPRQKAAYHCLEASCAYESDRLHDLKRHKASKHDSLEELYVSGRLIDCPYHGCGHQDDGIVETCRKNWEALVSVCKRHTLLLMRSKVHHSGVLSSFMIQV